MNTAPISALDTVPLTEDTRQRLAEAGVEAQRLVGLTEMGGQSLLVLYRHVNDDEGAHAPECFQREYNPRATICAGCVYAPRCWRGDSAYLDALRDGKVGSPTGVPQGVVAARLASEAKPPTPSRPRPGKVPPPPPPRKRKAPPPPPSSRRKNET